MNAKKNSTISDFLRRLLKGWGARLGFALLVFIILACLIGPILMPYGVNDIDLLNMFASSSKEHWFGCDAMGRDLLTRLLYGGRYSLALGLVAALLSAVLGMLTGLAAGYFGGRTESFLMRFMDVWSALPAMLLCILISAFMGDGFMPTVIALAVGGIPGSVRMTRGQALSERYKEYISAAESINCPKITIMLKHLLPNVIQPMIIIMTTSIGSTITMAAALSYIGLGIQPPTPEWGAMLSEGRNYIRAYPHLITYPGIFIAITVLALNLLGDGLRDALDPKLRE